jgi:hypothetical protein
MQAEPAPTMPPRPNTQVVCNDPVSDAVGYEAVCPVGYFRCCSTCKGATCFSEKGLHMSWRGMRECIRCSTGDYCNGCDTYERCRVSEVPGRLGPKISPAGSTRPQDCEICPAGFEADLKRQRCVRRWTDVCNMKFVGRCVRNCRAEDAKRMKNLNACEQMKCEIYCAKRWSDKCATAFGRECLYRKDGPSAFDLFASDEDWLTSCDVDCNSAVALHQQSLIVLLFLALVTVSR